MSQGAIIIDDSDPRILYSPGWQLDGADSDYYRTTHLSTTPGQSFTFKFNGTSVKVFGTLPSDTPSNSSYVLDDREPVFFNAVLTTNQYQQMFYSSPALTNTEHTLVGNCTSDSYVWIDFLFITSPPTEMPGMHGPIASPKPASASFPVGSAIGAVAGGAGLILLVLASVICFRYLRKFRGPVAHDSTEIEPTRSLQPFPLLYPASDALDTPHRDEGLVVASLPQRSGTLGIPPRKLAASVRQSLPVTSTAIHPPPPAYS